MFLDDDHIQNLHVSIFGRKPPLPRSISSKEELADCVAALEYQGTKRFLFYCLARRNYTSQQVKKKLKELLVNEQTASQVIEEMQQLGYLNDEDFVQNYVKSMLAQKKSSKYIVAKLRTKGIQPAHTIKFLDELDTDDQRMENLVGLLQGRYKLNKSTDYHTKQKIIASLFRKGFDIDDIKKAINTVTK